jgi:hypothetical protein
MSRRSCASKANSLRRSIRQPKLSFIPARRAFFFAGCPPILLFYLIAGEMEQILRNQYK